jgi:hypothetical protein
MIGELLLIAGRVAGQGEYCLQDVRFELALATGELLYKKGAHVSTRNGADLENGRRLIKVAGFRREQVEHRASGAAGKNIGDSIVPLNLSAQHAKQMTRGPILKIFDDVLEFVKKHHERTPTTGTLHCVHRLNHRGGFDLRSGLNLQHSAEGEAKFRDEAQRFPMRRSPSSTTRA